MPLTAAPPTPAQQSLDRLLAGDPAARADLLAHTRDRVRGIVRAFLARFPFLGRWTESDDVVQNVLVRLDRALARVRPPTTRDFLRLAARNVRRELVDLSRHHFGPEGVGANHATPGAHTPADHPGGADPADLAEWAELHARVAALPPDLREAVDLHYFQGLTHTEIADLTGASERTVRRRLVRAKLALREDFGNDE